MVRIFLLNLLLVLVSACTNVSEKRMVDIFPKQQKMTLQSVVFEIDSIRKPYIIEYCDDNLYFCDYGQSNFIRAFDWKTGKYIGDFAEKGVGPDEFIHLSAITAIDNKLGLWDMNRRVLSVLNFDSSKQLVLKSAEIEIVPDSILIAPFRVYPLEANLFVATGIIKGHRLALIDSLGHILSLFGRYPKENNEREYMDTENAFAYQGSVSYDPEEKVLTIGSMHGESIFFYDINDIHIPKLIREYIFVHPKYKDTSEGGSQSVAFSRDDITGIVDMKYLSKYCVCLFSGEKMSMGEPYKGGNKLLIFDNEGNPIKVVLLGQYYINIAANKDTNEIILLGSEPELSDYTLSKVTLADLIND